MLTIRGAKNVTAAINHYRSQNQSSKNEPPNITGSLWKSGRTGARFFKTEEGTPLLLYFRSRRLVENHVVAAHSALDLAAASKIAVVSQNGVGTAKFVIQATNANDPTCIEHVELTATSADEARRWVTTLLERRSYFLNLKPTQAAGRRPSQQQLAQAGIALFKRATGDNQVMLQAAQTARASDLSKKMSELAVNRRPSDLQKLELGVRHPSDLASKRTPDLQKPDLSRQKSTNSARDEGEVYFSASSDEEEVDGESKLVYMSAQQKLENAMKELANSPPSVFPEKMWGRPSFEGVPLRGFNYLNDHRKVFATRSLMKLVQVDCFSTGKKRLDHVSAHPQNRMAINKKNGTLPPFTWVIVYQVPGSPVNFSFVLYLVPTSIAICKLFDIENVDDKEAEAVARNLGLPPNYHKLLREFFFGKDDRFRNERFKMVPSIEEGPWLVKNAVPNKPALIGNKLTNRYFVNEQYMELDIDVGSSTVANKLTQLSIGYSTKLVVNLSFVLEGRDPKELPEEILGIASVINADIVRTALPLPV